ALENAGALFCFRCLNSKRLKKERNPKSESQKVRLLQLPPWFHLLAAFLLSCAAVAPAPGQTSTPSAMVEVPIKLHQGDLVVEARVNASDVLTFKLDTGFGITTISPNLAD